MNPIIVNAILILVSCFLSACISIILLRLNNAEAKIIIENRQKGIVEEIQTLLDTELAAFKPLISRSMTLAANAGAQAKKVQMIEREVVKAFQNDLPITPEMIHSFSPRLGEIVDENPELLLRAKEIIQKYMPDMDGINLNDTTQRKSTWLPEE